MDESIWFEESNAPAAGVPKVPACNLITLRVGTADGAMAAASSTVVDAPDTAEDIFVGVLGGIERCF